MWFVTLILLGITVVLALWGLDERSKFKQLDNGTGSDKK